jgi:hypothetical protein
MAGTSVSSARSVGLAQSKAQVLVKLVLFLFFMEAVSLEFETWLP